MIRKWLLTALACGVLAVAGCGKKSTGPEPGEKEAPGEVEKAPEKEKVGGPIEVPEAPEAPEKEEAKKPAGSAAKEK